MQNRRAFLKASAMMAGAGLASRVPSLPLAASSDSGWSKSAHPPRVEAVLNQEALKPRGQFYQATVPDTLDLAERARLSINVLTNNSDPDYGYYVFQFFDITENGMGPVPRTRECNNPAKNLRALPWLRTMCGSGEFLEQESGILRAMLGYVGKDGLLYAPLQNYRLKDTAYPETPAILALACDTHYAMDGNPAWLDWMRFLVAGLTRIAIRVEDRAYFPRSRCSHGKANGYGA
jgi:hypothetical protein